MDAGTLRLDLRGWRPRHEVKGPVCIDASVGLGRIVVIVPRAKRALIDVERAHVNAGSVTLYGQRSHGGQVDVAKVDRNFVLTPEQRNCASSQSKPPTTIANRKARLRLRLRLDAALGTIEVHRGQLPENTAQAVTTGT
jgi:hypothetical protein